MRQIRTISAIAFSFLIGGCGVPRDSQTEARAVEDSTQAHQTGTSSFSSSLEKPDCGLSVNSVNTTFALATLYSRNSPVRHVLLREQFTQSGCTNSEGLTGTVAVEGWVDRFEAGRLPSWQAQAEGHEGKIDGNFYKVTKRGCCGATPASVYFNLLSGKRVFESTVELIRINVPNTGNSRYVAFLDTWSISKPDEAKTNSGIVGALEYGSAAGPPERVILRLKTMNPFSIEDLSAAAVEEPAKYSKNLELRSANGAENRSVIGGFKLRIKLVEVGNDGREPTIVVPVSADRLDLGHAEASDGIEFRRIQTN